MPTVELLNQRVLFSPDIDPEIDNLLQQAVACAGDIDRSAGILRRVLAVNPNQLEAYAALYKLYCYSGRIGEAEEVALATLSRSAELAGIAADWNALLPTTLDWSQLHGPARAYLYALKALSFIRLRAGKVKSALATLHKLVELDPTDQVGGSVICDMAEAIVESEQTDLTGGNNSECPAQNPLHSATESNRQRRQP